MPSPDAFPGSHKNSKKPELSKEAEQKHADNLADEIMSGEKKMTKEHAALLRANGWEGMVESYIEGEHKDKSEKFQEDQGWTH